MIRRTIVVLCLAAAMPAMAQETFSPTDPLGPAAYFADRDECLAAAKSSKGESEGLFRAGRYLMAKAYGGQGKGGLKKNESFEYCRNAYGFFESAFRLKPEEPLYEAWAGAARLLSCAYGNIFETIQNGAKGVELFNAAIAQAPEDPALRLLRARAYAYLPRAFYPGCDGTMLEDSGIVIGQGSAAGELLDEALCYKCISLKQLDRSAEVAEFLARIEPASRFAAMARDWRKR
jgi:hypothetical protein